MELFQKHSNSKQQLKAPISQLFRFEALQMSKYSKVYVRNKKESNISLPLRFSFLRSIFVEKMCVKQAALKWKIHYSSAKIIARLAKKSQQELLFTSAPTPSIRCEWQELKRHQKRCANVVSKKEALGDSTDSSLEQGPQPSPNKLQVISTIGWNYMGEVS